ncbi:response regulator transcription factor [Mycobacterium sp. GA-2829]|uniref:response regulator transcription factor n=1 Tax=Mycobacterium sp. GA-2829 TaxID=1772283 RepID=UPI0007402D3C|nr:response regulator transcription factor [Mycobacterium sp. GA-2829]KUI36685.1 hypothetical protein AU194_22540 [Mycobacterium sp. GA-2829]
MAHYADPAEGGPYGLVAGDRAEAGWGVLREGHESWRAWGNGRPHAGYPVVHEGGNLSSALAEEAISSAVKHQTCAGSSPRARFLIIDDCTLHRESLAAVFAESGPAVAWDLSSLCATLGSTVPEIVLVNMGTRNSVSLVRVVRQMCPAAKVVAVGLAEDDEAEILACAGAGVCGYHLRTESLDDLRRLIARVAVDEYSCSPKVSAILLKRFSVIASQRAPEPRQLVLTAREFEILKLLELGLSNREIADDLCIAVHTVKNHVHAVLGKLGVRTRAQAAAYGRSVRAVAAAQAH